MKEKEVFLVANLVLKNNTSGGTTSVTADNFIGNASTASKWLTARTLTLSGDASGSVSIDGSGNMTLSVTVANDSHTHAWANITGKPSTFAPSSHTHDYLPLTGGTLSGNISYANGSYTNYEMIKFITGTGDGAGIVIGGGGLAVFGSGESASNLVSTLGLAGNTEETHITGDNAIYFHTNCQTIANRKTVSIDANGYFSGTVGWANVTGKPSTYSPSAHTNHSTITITSTSATGHLNFSRGSLNYITAPASGYFGFSPNAKGNTAAACDLLIDAGKVYPGTNNAVTLGTSSNRWSIIHTQRIICHATTDAAYGSDNGTGLQIGASSGTHLIVDNNEIFAKTNATTAGTLYIQSGSGTTEIGNVIIGVGDPTINVTGRADIGCLRLTNDGWTGYGTADPSGNLTAVVGRVYFRIT